MYYCYLPLIIFAARLCSNDCVKRNAVSILFLQISPNFRTAVTVPYQSWEKFVQLVEKAMDQKQAAAAAAATSAAAASAASAASAAPAAESSTESAAQSTG